MSEVTSSVFVSDTTGNVSVYDIKSGTILINYKTGIVNARCVCILKNDFILAAERSPLISAWKINSQEKVNSIRLVCPGIVSAIAASPDSCYIATVIAEKLLLWQVCNGRLLCTVRRHYQPINVLRWTEDGSDVLTGGDDGLVCVWKLSSLITSSSLGSSTNKKFICNQDGAVEPRFIFSDHSVKITDLYVGSGGYKARLFTISADKTCKIYDLSVGSLLLSVIFEDRPTAIVVDPLEVSVFVGSGIGNINTFSLLDAPRERDFHFKNIDTMQNMSYLGHTKCINHLECNMEGDVLLSSSADCTIKVWDISSKQCLRTIQLRGPVTNMFFKLLPIGITSKNFESDLVVNSFQKSYNENSDALEIITTQDLSIDHKLCSDDDYTMNECSKIELHLKEQLQKIKTINKQLYNFSIEKILSDVTTEQLPMIIKRKKNTVSKKIIQKNMQAENQLFNIKLKKRKQKRKKKIA